MALCFATVSGLARGIDHDSNNGSGGTWEGANEAIRRGFGPVAVWSGDGAGPGNAALLALGGTPMTDVHDVFEITGQPTEPRVQGSLFG